MSLWIRSLVDILNVRVFLPAPPKFILHLQTFFKFLNNSLTRRHHTFKIMLTSRSQNIWLSKVKIYHRKSTFISQNISPEVDFQKSKYITESRLLEVKINHRKSTSGNQKSSPEVDFRKSKIFPEVDFRKSKKFLRKLTSVSKKSNFILNIFNSF